MGAFWSGTTIEARGNHAKKCRENNPISQEDERVQTLYVVVTKSEGRKSEGRKSEDRKARPSNAEKKINPEVEVRLRPPLLGGGGGQPRKK